MIKRQPHGLPVDVWSFGICCMEMANGHVPNRKSSIAAMFLSATEGYPMPFEDPDEWSESFSDFMARCLHCDPTLRWTVLQLMEHPFLTNCASVEDMCQIFTEVFQAKPSVSSVRRADSSQQNMSVISNY